MKGGKMIKKGKIQMEDSTADAEILSKIGLDTSQS